MPNAGPAPAPPISLAPPEVSLLTSADPLPPEVASYDRWRTGLAQRNISEMTAGLWQSDCVTETTKADINDERIDEFVPVIVYTHHGCNGRVDEDEYRSEATAVLEAKAAYALGSELWTGAVSGNPSLQSTAIDLTGLLGGPVSVGAGISVLTEAYSQAANGVMGTLHVPYTILHELTLNNLIVRTGNRLKTIIGQTVIPGPGYPSSGNTAPEGSEEPAAGSYFIYITGPVQVGLGPVVITGTETNSVGGYARQNLVEFYAEQAAIYRFPGQPVFAVAVNAISFGG